MELPESLIYPYVSLVELYDDVFCYIEAAVPGCYRSRKDVSLSCENHRVVVLSCICVEELLDGVTDVVHHNLLLFSDFLVLLIREVIEIVSLLLEFLALNLSD